MEAMMICSDYGDRNHLLAANYIDRGDDHDHACRGCGQGIFCNATTDQGCAAIFEGYCSDCEAELAAEDDARLTEADRVNGYSNDGFGN
jgi:hypothetical protein